MSADRQPFAVIELCCNVCGRAWTKMKWRDDGGFVGPDSRLGVDVSNVKAGPFGSKLWKCGCRYQCVIDTEALHQKVRQAAENGTRRLVAGRDV